jgi:hypothetical protein
MVDSYNILIIGAGIAGLYTAIEYLKRYPKHRVAIAESYHIAGGRMSTFSADISGTHYQWEMGGARISEHHTILLRLLKHYGLETIPISGEVQFKESGAHPIEPDNFGPALPITFGPLVGLSPEILRSNTLRQLLSKFYKPKELEALLIRHPYRGELDTMRADIALQLFQHEFSPEEKYVLCKSGLSSIIKKMVEDFEGRGGKLFLKHKLLEVKENKFIFKSGGGGRSEIVFEAEKAVFAIPSPALAQIRQFTSWATLKHLAMKPLLRVYAVFPPDSTGHQWFEDLPKTVTAERPRYIIPGNLKTGSIQISYTDSIDTEPLMQILKEHGEGALGAELVKDLRILFNKKIPDPLFVKAHPWNDGVTYWLPGDYNPVILSKEAIQPFKDKQWFVTGESYSTRQGWIEGGLEHATLALTRILKAG